MHGVMKLEHYVAVAQDVRETTLEYGVQKIIYEDVTRTQGRRLQGEVGQALFLQTFLRWIKS